MDTAAAGERGASGAVARGPDGAAIAHGSVGERGVVAGPNGVAGGAREASGTVIKGPDGGVYRTARRAAAASTPAHAARARGIVRPPICASQGNFVRSNFSDYGRISPRLVRPLSRRR